MAVYQICTKCQTKVGQCFAFETHKEFHLWKADFYLGGKLGKRVRIIKRTRELAKAEEGQQQTDFVRGKLFPMDVKSKIPFSVFCQEWYNKYVTLRLKNPKAEWYHVVPLKSYFKEKPIHQISFSDGEGFIQSSIKDGKSPGAVNRDLTTLHSMFKWGVNNGYLAKSPFVGLKDLKGETVRVRWMSKEEFSKLLEASRQLKDEDLVDLCLFGVMTGFRKGNLRRFTAQDINEPFITASRTKSGVPYDVPISDGLRQLLSRLKDKVSTGPLLKTQGLDKRFRRAVKLAGLWRGTRDPNSVTLHVLRHTFAAWYLKAGGDIYKLSKLLGHSSVSVTEKHYGHLCQRDMAAQASTLNFDVMPQQQIIELKIA